MDNRVSIPLFNMVMANRASYRALENFHAMTRLVVAEALSGVPVHIANIQASNPFQHGGNQNLFSVMLMSSKVTIYWRMTGMSTHTPQQLEELIYAAMCEAMEQTVRRQPDQFEYDSEKQAFYCGYIFEKTIGGGE